MDADKLAYLTIRHQQGSQRYSKPLTDKIVRVLNTADEQLVEVIASRYAMMQAKGVDRGPKTTERLNDTLEAVRTINREVYAKVGETTRTALTDLAKHEIDFTNRALQASGSVNLNALVPSSSFLKTLVETSPIATDSNGGGAILQSWIDRMETGRLGRLEDAIRGGLARGAGTDDLVKLIRGTKAKQYTDGVLDISRRSAQTVALTANSTIQNQARLETFRATRTVKFLEWSSVLDGRTSKPCQDLSGKVFAIDEPHPTAPRHPRCRSLLIPRRDNVGTKHKTYAEYAKRGADDAEKADFKTLDDLKTFDDDLLTEIEKAPLPVAKPKATIIDPKAIDAREKSYVLDMGRKSGTEHLVAYDERTGEIIERKEGNRSSVSFTPTLVAALDDPRNEIVLHHNHPGSSSLSLPDMMVVTKRRGAKAIWAHAHNGSSFYAERGKRALKKTTVDAISSKFQEALQKLINMGAVKVEDAILLHNHLTWLAVHHVGEINYRAELEGESKAAFERNKVLYERLLESLK